MPNCDFYGTPEDYPGLLSWLFSEAKCHVFELASEFGKPLKQFESVDAVLRQFDRRSPTEEKRSVVLLQLYVIGAGPKFTPRRVRLDPQAGDRASFRYEAEGWGLVQLYLASATAHGLENSHTNHNSRKRAEAWAPQYRKLADPSAGFNHFRLLVRLNRQIKKVANSTADLSYQALKV